MVATTEAVVRRLGAGKGLLYRYLPDESPDGIEGHEGAFLLCSFWLVDNLAKQGRFEEAMELYDSLCGRAGPLGLLPEQIDPASGTFLGYYPQAFSHVGVISSGINLARLEADGLLPKDFRVTGVSRHDWDTAAFREKVREKAGTSLVDRLEFFRGDVTDGKRMAEIAGDGGEPVVIYLALPPTIFAPAVRALQGLNLAEGSRLVLEKPFGESLETAQELNRLLHRAFPEEAIFRVDHFLAYQTIQNILGLRFANRILEYAWNREHVERVDIVWDETLALEGRAGYYDRAGALKDMIQNHLLQLLCLVGMDAPATLGERDLRDRKVDVLRAVRRLSPAEVERMTVRGRYTAGRTGDRNIPAYADEPGVDPARKTESFAQVTLWIDNWRWQGVPFVLRTGKALARDKREIAVRFRDVPHLAFEAAAPAANVLRIQLAPNRISLQLNVSESGDPMPLRCLELDSDLASHGIPAYARVLLDILEGRSTLSIRADEAEEAWRIVEPILGAWSSLPLREYPAGSGGPDAAR